MSTFARLSLGVAFLGPGVRSSEVPHVLPATTGGLFLVFGTGMPPPTSERAEPRPGTLRGFSIGIRLPAANSQTLADDAWSSPWRLTFESPQPRERTRRPRLLWSKRVGM
jgi:hypothetical protein